MEFVCSFGLVVRRVGSFSYTPRAGNFLVFRRVGSLSDTPLAGIVLVVRRVGSFSYTPCAGICLVHKRLGDSLKHPAVKPVSSFVGRGVSITRPMMASVLFGSVGSFSYTPLC